MHNVKHDAPRVWAALETLLRHSIAEFSLEALLDVMLQGEKGRMMLRDKGGTHCPFPRSGMKWTYRTKEFDILRSAQRMQLRARDMLGLYVFMEIETSHDVGAADCVSRFEFAPPKPMAVRLEEGLLSRESSILYLAVAMQTVAGRYGVPCCRARPGIVVALGRRYTITDKTKLPKRMKPMRQSNEALRSLFPESETIYMMVIVSNVRGYCTVSLTDGKTMCCVRSKHLKAHSAIAHLCKVASCAFIDHFWDLPMLQ